MVNPISNSQFSHDSVKYVYQYLSDIPVGPVGEPKVPFIERTKAVDKSSQLNRQKQRTPWNQKNKKGRTKGDSDSDIL